ncbi:MAG: radical SAM protein [Candidatus Omnitrophica bacterium]|nr:radical SAM protein [Candidatus Omnitrophota bacterium]
MAEPIQLPVLGTNGYPLQDAAVYGPIHSRRYGHSLGINPLPVTYKFCDFDCVYCQYGWTPQPLPPTAARTEESSAQTELRALRPGSPAKKTNERLKSLAQLISEIESAFQRFKAQRTPIDVMTIAGNGEPTLYPRFLRFVQELIQLRNRYFPNVKIGILSDSTQCHRLEIKQALELLDERCMKLDAGDQEIVGQINKPIGKFNFEKMLAALKALHSVTIQSLFVQGSCGNATPKQIDHWIRAIDFVQPSSVQVYTIDRPPADSGIRVVPVERLREIAELCEKRTGISTEVFD